MFATLAEAERAARMLGRFGIEAHAYPPNSNGRAYIQVYPRLADDSPLGSWDQVADVIERRGRPPQDERARQLSRARALLDETKAQIEDNYRLVSGWTPFDAIGAFPPEGRIFADLWQALSALLEVLA